MELTTVPIDKPADVNFILGQSHFIKTIEDLHEAIVQTVPQMKFGIAFCESSGPALVRRTGNDDGARRAGAEERPGAELRALLHHLHDRRLPDQHPQHHQGGAGGLRASTARRRIRSRSSWPTPGTGAASSAWSMASRARASKPTPTSRRASRCCASSGTSFEGWAGDVGSGWYARGRLGRSVEGPGSAVRRGRAALEAGREATDDEIEARSVGEPAFSVLRSARRDGGPLHWRGSCSEVPRGVLRN